MKAYHTDHTDVLCQFFEVVWQNLDDLTWEDNRYTAGYFKPFDSDWQSDAIFKVYHALG